MRFYGLALLACSVSCCTICSGHLVTGDDRSPIESGMRLEDRLTTLGLLWAAWEQQVRR